MNVRIAQLGDRYNQNMLGLGQKNSREHAMTCDDLIPTQTGIICKAPLKGFKLQA